MKIAAKVLRYVAKWCDAIAWSWQTRGTTTLYHRTDMTIEEIRRGFWQGMKTANKSIHWDEA